MNKKSIFALCTLGLMLGACGAPQTAITPSSQANQPVSDALRNMKVQPASETGRWFVEFVGEPGSVQAKNSHLHQQNMLRALGQDEKGHRTLSAQQVFEQRDVTQFGRLFNGVALALSEQEVAQVSKMPGVKAVYPIKIHRLPAVQKHDTVIKPYMFTAIEQGGVTQVHNEFGLTGKGVNIAIIDTGINVNHPAFAGRIKKQWDFTGDNIAEGGDDTPDDCHNHGSHVAGIAAGNDPSMGFKGVAPEANIFAYRIFDCAIESNDELVMKAFERAHADGADVVNFSVGIDFAWGDNPTSQAFNRMMEEGIFVAIASGNSGTQGQFTLGSPSTAEEPLGVAAAGNTHINAQASALVIDGVRKAVFFPNIERSGNILKDFVITDPANGCNVSGVSPFANGQYADKTLIIESGDCQLSEKANNAIKAGANGLVIVAADGASPVRPNFGRVRPDFSYGMLSKADGDKLKEAVLAGKNVELQINRGFIPSPNTEADAVTAFSAVGDTPDLLLKPEIIAPGGEIISAASKNSNVDYISMSGTSMATPFVAGAAALLLEKYPDLNAYEVRNRLMNTSTPLHHLDHAAKQRTDDFAQVQRQGAGMVNIHNAVLNTLSANPHKLALGASHGAPVQVHSVELHNRNTIAQKVQLRHQPALAFGGVINDLTAINAAASMTVNGQPVSESETMDITVPANGKVKLRVVIRPPANAPEHSQYGGWLVADGGDAHNTVVVPYSGYKGNYQARPVLGATVKLTDEKVDYVMPVFYDPAGEGEGRAEGLNPVMPIKPVFTFTEQLTAAGKKDLDNPVLFTFFAQPANRFILEAVDKNGKVVRTIKDTNHVPRSGDPVIKPLEKEDKLRRWEWDGKNDAGADVPAGDYKLQIRILRVLGNPNNPAHWEKYTTPVFEVKR